MFRRQRHLNLLRGRPFPGVGRVRSRRRAVTAILFSGALLGAILALVVGYVGAVTATAFAHANAGRKAVEAAIASVKMLDVESALTQVRDADVEFGAADRALARVAVLERIPWIGERAVAAGKLLTAGRSAAAAAEETLLAVRDIASVFRDTQTVAAAAPDVFREPAQIFRGLDAGGRRRMLAGLAADAPHLAPAADKADAAIADLDRLAADPIAAGFAASLAEARSRLVLMRDVLRGAAPFAGALPALLGYPAPKRYLLFFENNTELRPTGGFLGTYALITVQDAAVTAVETKDVYSLDGPNEQTARPAPPEPLRRYIGIDKWYLRDANWSPDFSVAAPLMARFFREEAAVALGKDRAPAIDGVVAVTPELASAVMRVVGPVSVDGTTFDSHNLTEVLEYQVEKAFAEKGVPFHARKDILARLVDEVSRRIGSLSVADMGGLVTVVQQALDEKHLLIWSEDPAVQRLVAERRWAGALRPARGDYLLAVDANLASLKTDAVMVRSMEYSFKPETDRTYVGTVRLKYANGGRFDWKTTRYRTYARVYLPPGTTFLGVSGAMQDDKLKDPARRPGTADVSDELDRRVFGAFISIEPGESRVLEFRFRLAAAVAEAIRSGKYVLDVDKQAGTVANGLTLDLDFGKKLKAAEPPEKREEFGDSRYRLTTDLRVDRSFQVSE